MVIQYPHYLFIQEEVKPVPERDNSGNWLEPVKTWVFHSKCREKPSDGKGTIIQGADNEALVFSSLVLLPRGTAKVEELTKVRVVETKDAEGVKRIEGRVLKYKKGQLNSKLWL